MPVIQLEELLAQRCGQHCPTHQCRTVFVISGGTYPVVFQRRQQIRTNRASDGPPALS